MWYLVHVWSTFGVFCWSIFLNTSLATLDKLISIAAIEGGKPHPALRRIGREGKTALPAFHKGPKLLLAASQREILLAATDQVCLTAKDPILLSTSGKEEEDASLQDLKQPNEDNGQVLWGI